ncbi:MAG: hypothetical protein L6R28_06670 [Planctomycetes bacterium]|nr:hypothetical protein [Planctomycetota bacterium]
MKIVLTVLILLSPTPISASTVINFDSLPGNTDPGATYPGIVFSTTAGNLIKTNPFDNGTSLPNTLCSFNSLKGDCSAPVFVAFNPSVANLTFKASGADANGGANVADVRVTHSGGKSTIKIKSSGSTQIPTAVDLSSFINVSLVEISNQTDPAGLVFDDFTYDPGIPEATILVSDRSRSISISEGEMTKITAGPAMPLIGASLDVDSSIDILVKWRMEVLYEFNVSKSKAGAFKKKKVLVKVPKSGNVELPANVEWNVTSELNGLIVGGNATIFVDCPQLFNSPKNFSFNIGGENPGQFTVEDYIDSLTPDVDERKMLKVIFAHESARKQFSDGAGVEPSPFNDTKGFPLISFDGLGAGLFQITNGIGGRVNYSDHWDWTFNVRRGIEILRSKVVDARKSEEKETRRSSFAVRSDSEDRIDVYQRYNGGVGLVFDGASWVPPPLPGKSKPVANNGYGLSRISDEMSRFGVPTSRPALTKPVKIVAPKPVIP